MKKLNFKVALTIYFVIWVLAVMMFWLFKVNEDAMGYSILVFFVALPVTSLLSSLLIGLDKKVGKIKYFIPILFGIFYMLAEYLTFSLANMLEFNHINIPELSLILTGTTVAYIGLLIGVVIKKQK